MKMEMTARPRQEGILAHMMLSGMLLMATIYGESARDCDHDDVALRECPLTVVSHDDYEWHS